jgi:hypothetical protein
MRWPRAIPLERQFPNGSDVRLKLFANSIHSFVRLNQFRVREREREHHHKILTLTSLSLALTKYSTNRNAKSRDDTIRFSTGSHFKAHTTLNQAKSCPRDAASVTSLHQRVSSSLTAVLANPPSTAPRSVKRKTGKKESTRKSASLSTRETEPCKCGIPALKRMPLK